MKTFITSLLFAFAFQLSNGQIQIATFGDYQLDNGEILKNTRIGYQTFGKLNTTKDNALLFTTWYGGTGESLKPYIGKETMIDTTQFYLIVIEALGNGISSSSSNTILKETEKFPTFSIRDMVNLQHRLLTKELGLKHLYGVTGISMGGMQTYQWMASYPDFFDKAIPIVGSPKLSLYDQLNYRIFLNILESEITTNANKGTYLMLEYTLGLTPKYYQEETKTVEAFTEEILEQNKTYNPVDLYSQMLAIANFSLDADFKRQKAKALADVFNGETLIIYSSTDHLVSPGSNRDAIDSLKAESLDSKSVCGHYSFSCDIESITSTVSTFLNKTSN
ncbi:MAG: alpha/beta fold hydrolase [Leeuwenhoekiella sp.]